MLIFGRQVLVTAARRHPDAARALFAWAKVVEDADWRSIIDVRHVYPTADGVSVASGVVVTVFNIRGNNYRRLAWLNYREQRATMIDLLTHAEYSAGRWKKRL